MREEETICLSVLSIRKVRRSGAGVTNSLENEMFEEFMPSKVQKIDQFISKTSDKEREKLDKQIGRAFFANNFSFQSIENSEFVKAIQMLRPGYTPPSRIKFLSPC